MNKVICDQKCLLNGHILNVIIKHSCLLDYIHEGALWVAADSEIRERSRQVLYAK